jgi:PHD/YefM family antitoxin component YafN of YafNO toxin-antitoxin module
MQNTNPKRFRAELKDYLDLAAKEPIRIQRRSGESFILLKEQSYQDLQSRSFHSREDCSACHK